MPNIALQQSNELQSDAENEHGGKESTQSSKHEVDTDSGASTGSYLFNDSPSQKSIGEFSCC